MKKKSGSVNPIVIPTPPHPSQRREPLPWNSPGTASGDPDAARRVRQIMDSPGYQMADQDVDFLGRQENRGIRLQIDYEKPQQFLEEHGIQNTIVVFGSTRIQEPAVAEQRLKALSEQVQANPTDQRLQHCLAVAERIKAKSRYYQVAQEFGQLVGAAGLKSGDGRLVIMTGGGPGIMEAANRGAHDVGGESIGLNIKLPQEQYPNSYITPGLCFRFHYFALRKLHFLLRTRALVAFPGGYGTLDELFEALTLVQTRSIKPVPIVLVGESYWRQAINIDFLVDEGVIDDEDRELFWYAETAQDIWHGILQWHDTNGTPLLS